VTFHFDQRVPDGEAINDVDFRASLLSEADEIMSEAARRFGSVWAKKETMFEGLGSLSLDKGREGAMESLDPVGSVVKRYVRAGEWREGREDFVPSGAIINAVLKLKPELWNQGHGRTWVQREAVRAMKTQFGVDVHVHKMPGRINVRGYKSVTIDIEKLVEEIGLEQFCKGLEKGARSALEHYYKLDLSGFSMDSEEIADEDLNM
jgi:hypothetical protein